jgi:hypothetical protein
VRVLDAAHPTGHPPWIDPGGAVPDPVGSEREPEPDHVPPGRWTPARHDHDRPAILNVVARSAPTIRIAGRDRWPVVWTGLIGLFLVGALLKPWATASLGPAPSEPAAALAPAPGGSGGPDPLASLREHCQEPLGWRVYSRELWIGRQVRTWRSLEPVGRASGPSDRAIPLVALGPFVDALGYCSPWTGPERPPDDARMSAWRDNVDGAASGVTAVPLRARAPDRPSVLGGLFGQQESPRPAASPGGAASPVPSGWPASRYVFALRATGWERWWAVQVAAPDASDASDPEPVASADPPAAGSASP